MGWTCGSRCLSALLVGGLRADPGVPRNRLARQLHELGHNLLWGDRYAEAEAPLREALAARVDLDPGGWETTKSRFWLAISLLLQKKYAEAERMLLECDRQVAERLDKAPARVKHFPAEVARRLVEIYTALEKPDEAEKWSAERLKRRSAK